jgi:hypothetical protein
MCSFKSTCRIRDSSSGVRINLRRNGVSCKHLMRFLQPLGGSDKDIAVQWGRSVTALSRAPWLALEHLTYDWPNHPMQVGIQAGGFDRRREWRPAGRIAPGILHARWQQTRNGPSYLGRYGRLQRRTAKLFAGQLRLTSSEA